MTQIRNRLPAALFAVLSPPWLLVAQSPSNAHYYVYESTEDGDSVVNIVEVYAADASSPGPEFREVSLETLHEMGCLTAAEQLAITPPADVSVVSPHVGFEAKSWVSIWPDSRPPRKWPYVGSETKRPYPGQLFLDADYKEFKDGKLCFHHARPPLWTQYGDSLIRSFRKTYTLSTILHVEQGEHAFTLPPEGLIHTHAEGKR